MEFLRRFVQHVLPRGYMKIRHYGLLANRQRKEKLQQCRRLLLVDNAATVLNGADASPAGDAARIEPASPPHCPQCGGQRLLRMEVPKEGMGSPPTWGDTS